MKIITASDKFKRCFKIYDLTYDEQLLLIVVVVAVYFILSRLIYLAF